MSATAERTRHLAALPHPLRGESDVDDSEGVLAVGQKRCCFATHGVPQIVWTRRLEAVAKSGSTYAVNAALA
jgi:hypothetical protein